ncbi:winged helix-turn-helix transcriptional regulator [Bradyrhizobium sp. HKCCYLR20261]|uniref:winged helix-turn-helix transcriptional regulator n=1 Tax=unclassified Bradyrhizobium TaxID=2631580 RepID=UPI003EC0BA60
MSHRAALADDSELADEYRAGAGKAEMPVHASATDKEAPSASMPARPRILLVGDKSFTSLLKYILDSNGFDCLLIGTLADAIAAATVARPGVIALDDMACGDRLAGALEQLQRTPATQHVPTLIMASAPPRFEDECIHADRTSYILKPFLPDIFIDRLRGLLRASASPGPKVLRFADIVMESEAHRVSRGGRCIRLCPVEYRILQHLLESPRKVFSREQILSSIRAHTQENAVRSIDVHISRIRKALCERGEPNYIRTVRGLGYSLDFAPDGPTTYVPRPELVRSTRSCDDRMG